MKSLFFSLFLLLIIDGCNSYQSKKSVVDLTKIDPLTTEGVIAFMQKTSQWQIDNLPNTMVLPGGIIEPLTANSWVRATFLSGMMAYYDIIKNEEIFNYVDELCKGVNYELGERIRHADEFAIGKVYADIYLKNQNKKVIANMSSRIDDIIKNPSRGSEVGWHSEQNWSWCDALFMAPPAWIKLYACTLDEKYLKEMDILFWETYDYLYSKNDSLFYRDSKYFWDTEGNGKKTLNGHKIFWGRGNGWIMGGLAEILNYLPSGYPNRGKYEQLFREMISKIVTLQGDDGMWRSSLLDYEQYSTKEFSGSAFFCYAMAWGINHQLLDKEIFWPRVEKAWLGLADCVQEDGKIGFVQRVGASPESVKAEDTMEYGTGAFLLAGKEIYEIVNR